MMDLGQRKEQFSHAYVRAVASVAGFSITITEVDDDSVDMTITGRSFDGIPCRPRIDIQLKCTAGDVIRGNKIVYSLKRKNHDELTPTNRLVPRLLVVVHVPDSEEEWLRHSEDELALRRCGYWVSLHGEPETTNQTKVTVRLPRTNTFDIAGLRGLMSRSSRKEPL